MSVQALTCALAMGGLGPSEKLLLIALANYADAAMRCYPSNRRLCEDTGLSERTVRTVLKALEDRRIISRLERTRSDGSRTSDLVTLHFAGLILAPPHPGAEIAGGGATIAGGAGQPLPGGGAMIAPLTTFEPVTEPKREADASLSSKPTKDARGSRIAADWKPGEAETNYALKEGLSLEEIDREADKFRDYYLAKAGAGARRVDWYASWRTWVRNACDRRAGPGVAGGQGSGRGGQRVTSFAGVAARRRGLI